MYTKNFKVTISFHILFLLSRKERTHKKIKDTFTVKNFKEVKRGKTSQTQKLYFQW